MNESRGSQRLYFFPTLQPFISAVPFLLSGCLALVGGISAGWYYFRYRTKSMPAIIIGFVLLVGLSTRSLMKSARIPFVGPRLITSERLPPVLGAGSRSRWTQLLPRPPVSNLSVSQKHGLLIFGTDGRTVDALKTYDGTLAFSIATNYSVISTPVIFKDQVYFGEGVHDSDRANLVSARLPDGAILWYRTFDGHIESGPRVSVDGQRLWGCAGEAGVYSLRVLDGAEIWTRNIGHCDTTPWFANDKLYVLVQAKGTTSKLHILDPVNGNGFADIDLPGLPWGTIQSDPATGFLIMTTGVGQIRLKWEKGEAGWLHAFDPVKQVMVWSEPMSGLSLIDGLLFPTKKFGIAVQTLKMGKLEAFNTLNGAKRWEYSRPSPLLSAARVLPDHLFENPRLVSLALDGTLSELDLKTGAVISITKLTEGSMSAPAFDSLRGYFATRDSVFAIPFGLERTGGR